MKTIKKEIHLWDNELKEYLEKNTGILLGHFKASREKYIEIWEYYKEHMPVCIKECTEAKKEYTEEPYRDGPQGIYWIGSDPVIFFIGRDHMGWYGEAKWPDSVDTICCAPLQFSFYTVESMGTYWAIIKDIMSDVLESEKKNLDWNMQLERVEVV